MLHVSLFQGEAILNNCLKLFGKDYKYSVSNLHKMCGLHHVNHARKMSKMVCEFYLRFLPLVALQNNCKCREYDNKGINDKVRC